MNGKVYLVGAGPGDPRLITLRGAEVLQRADLILYDGLANDALLRWAPASCIRSCVGKRGHGGHWSQSQIHDALRDAVKTHHTVVRLKGGDTAVFARTSEEIEFLESQGIEYEVIPGLTAALAVSAYTGIPLTHRDWASGVAIVTGQGQANDGYTEAEEPIDWHWAATFPGTIVLYMASTNAGQWSRAMIEAGKPPTTPVSLVHRCSWPDQRVVPCELGTIEDTLAAHPDLRAPLLCVVGEVTRYTSQIGSRAAGPLFGCRCAVTGPNEHAQGLVSLLQSQGATCIAAPTFDIAPPNDWRNVDAVLEQIASWDWVVFSSVHGVQSFFQRMHENNLDARALATVRVAAVGETTANAMLTYGVRCDLKPTSGSGAEALWDVLKSHISGKRVLLVRAPEGGKTLETQCHSLAAQVGICESYQQRSIPWTETVLTELKSSPETILVVTSKNGADHTCLRLGEATPKHRWLSISPKVTESLIALGIPESQIITSECSDYEGMVQSLVRAVHASHLVDVRSQTSAGKT